MLQQDKPQDFVIGTNSGHSVREFCEIAFAQVGLNWEDHVISNEKLMRPTEIKELNGDASKAKEVLGWEPKTSFEELVKIMVDADLERFK
jgi:GDPmannose 4,6-dehydratase